MANAKLLSIDNGPNYKKDYLEKVAVFNSAYNFEDRTYRLEPNGLRWPSPTNKCKFLVLNQKLDQIIFSIGDYSIIQPKVFKSTSFDYHFSSSGGRKMVIVHRGNVRVNNVSTVMTPKSRRKNKSGRRQQNYNKKLKTKNLITRKNIQKKFSIFYDHINQAYTEDSQHHHPVYEQARDSRGPTNFNPDIYMANDVNELKPSHERHISLPSKGPVHREGFPQVRSASNIGGTKKIIHKFHSVHKLMKCHFSEQ